MSTPFSRRPSLRWSIAALLGVAALAVSSSSCTSLGQRPAGERLARAQQSPQWRDGQFRNLQPQWTDNASALRQAFDSTPGDTPAAGAVPVQRGDGAALAVPPASGLRVTWFGHSSTLLEIDGIRILTDPIWSDRASPVSWIGPARWYPPPIALTQLPPIDVVVVSHDHYDHLDYATIMAMKDSPTRFVVPLGLGAHLAAWGIPAERVVELDWWQSTRIGAVELVATPARHATGRLRPDADLALWSGFAFIGPAHRAYYSGDTGLLPAMHQIGARLGPFDVTLIEAGQYDAAWPDWHLGPEQAVLAHRMVRGKVMLPVHWGLFKLAHHGWTEPAERVLAAAACQGVKVLIPKPGQSVEPDTQAALAPWWPTLPWRSAEQRPVIATVNGRADARVPSAACPLQAVQ